MKKINYSKLEEITVKNQEELNDIPLDFKGRIYIKFGTYSNPAIVRNSYYYSVRACDNSTVEAYDNSTVEACDNSTVEAYDNSTVKACGNSTVKAYDNSTVIAYDNSTVIACGNSTVRACGNSTVRAYNNSTVEAYDNSTVRACDNSTVRACDNSTVIACGNSTVRACGNSTVRAYNNSTVRACDNSTVRAYNNSTVEACGNVQVLNRQFDGKINVKGNARIVHDPENINEFIDFHGIEHTKTTATFYKAVRKDSNGIYRADRDKNFIYEIGKYKTEKCDSNVKEDCSYGIHISTLNWALNFGKNWNNLAILEVKTKISDIVLPEGSDGKVRTSKVKVIREVPLEEYGVDGKILIKER